MSDVSQRIITIEDYTHDPELHALADRIIEHLDLDVRTVLEVRVTDEGVEATVIKREDGWAPSVVKGGPLT